MRTIVLVYLLTKLGDLSRENVGKYSIHGAYGYANFIKKTRFDLSYRAGKHSEKFHGLLERKKHLWLLWIAMVQPCEEAVLLD